MKRNRFKITNQQQDATFCIIFHKEYPGASKQFHITSIRVDKQTRILYNLTVKTSDAECRCHVTQRHVPCCPNSLLTTFDRHSHGQRHQSKDEGTCIYKLYQKRVFKRIEKKSTTYGLNFIKILQHHRTMRFKKKMIFFYIVLLLMNPYCQQINHQIQLGFFKK